MDDTGAAGDTAKGGQGNHCHYPQKLHVFLLGLSTLEPIKIDRGLARALATPNNRAGNSYQPTRRREHEMHRLKSAGLAQWMAATE
jgi:hypothetical protein